MNRVIKFRVWDTELKIWVNNIGMQRNNILCNGNEKRFHVMQFTGRHDKNGMEVYEGDILDCGRIVCFYAACFVLFSPITSEYWMPLYNLESYEVIGNIHQTPTPSI